MDMKQMKKQAKIDAIKAMRSIASDAMKGPLKDKIEGMKKVTVAADSSEGLKKGLEKAKELTDKMPEEMMDMSEDMEDESEESESEESPKEEMDEILEKCESPEEIDALIKKLEAKKAMLK